MRTPPSGASMPKAQRWTVANAIAAPPRSRKRLRLGTAGSAAQFSASKTPPLPNTRRSSFSRRPALAHATRGDGPRH